MASHFISDIMNCDDFCESSEPRFLELLTPEDREQYTNLKQSLTGAGTRNRRGKRLEAFADMLEKVKEYSIRGDDDDWKRSLVCGVCWVDSIIAINTRQLKCLISKCKSSINGSLHRMGYNPAVSGGDFSSALMEKIPFLKGNFSELRQWTIRQQSVMTPQPIHCSELEMPKNKQLTSPQPSFEAITSSSSNENLPENNDSSLYDPFSLPLEDWVFMEDSRQSESYEM